MMNRRHAVLTIVGIGLICGTGLCVFAQATDENNVGSQGLRSEDSAFTQDFLGRPVRGARREQLGLDQASLKLTQQYARTTDAEKRAKLASDLANIVEKQFDARQQTRATELDELEKQLRRLRDIHDRRERERQRIVNDRVQQLLREAEGLGWGSSVPGRTEWRRFQPSDDASLDLSWPTTPEPDFTTPPQAPSNL